MRLMRSRMVLGEVEAAREAHKSGLAAFEQELGGQGETRPRRAGTRHPAGLMHVQANPAHFFKIGASSPARASRPERL